MKKRWVAIITCMMVTTVLFSGCSGSGTADSGESEKSAESAETLYGQVTEVSDGSITIDIGTLKEESPENDEQPSKDTQSADEGQTADEGSSKDEGSLAGKAENGGEEMPSMLELTGETQTITITDNTTVTRQSMGRFGGRGGQGQPSDAPSGENGEQAAAEGQPPEKPDDDGGQPGDRNGDAGNASGQPDGGNGGPGNASGQPDDRNGQPEEAAVEDISVGDTVSINLDSDGNAAEIQILFSSMENEQAGGGGQSAAPDSYASVVEYTSDTTESGQAITSEGTDENAIHMYEGADVTLQDFTVDRTSAKSTGGDASSFYGIGAAVLATDGTAHITGSEIQTDAAGGAGIFAYGDATVYVSDTKIITKQDTSGGIHTAGGGTLYAWDMDIVTDGASSAAIRSDRGGGTMVVDGGTYTSDGTGSPAIYCTADIAAHSATLTANQSEAVCIEGLNSLHIYDSDLTGNMPDDVQNDCAWNIILYQSMSGDSEEGNSTFEMAGGSLAAQNGGMFYTTNTESTFILSDVDITYADENDFFLRCTGNQNQRGWGDTGNNGADSNFTAISQEMRGDIVWDSISELDFYMTEESALTGAVVDDESCAGNGGDGYCSLYIEKGSTWTVTADSILTNLLCSGTIQDTDGNTVTIKGTDGTIFVKGNGKYTVTVDSYSDEVDLSGASQASGWPDYEVDPSA